jgi:hypothetical protein
MTELTGGKAVSEQVSRGSILLMSAGSRQKQSVRWQRMRIVKSVQTKVCVDGSLMKEYVMDEPLSQEFLMFLQNFGTVQFLEQLKKPYFSFEKDQFISIKGFVGDSNVEVRYKKEFQDLIADYFHLLLFYFCQGDAGILTLRKYEDLIREKMKIRSDSQIANGV